MLSLPLLLLSCIGPKDDGPMDSPTVDSPEIKDTPADDSPDDSGRVDQAPLTFVGERPRNLLVLTLDTLRRDRLNALGYGTRVTSPNLDQLLAHGVSFVEHQSCGSWTFSSFICALSGMDQLTAGYWPSLPDTPNTLAPDSLITMAEIFSDNGYRTRLVSANPYLGEGHNLGQGYDRIHVEQLTSAAEIGPHALQAVADMPEDQPWMLHLHLVDPHAPYTPPQVYLQGVDALGCEEPLETLTETRALFAGFRELSQGQQEACLAELNLRYDAEVRFMDEWVGRIVQQVEDAGLWEDTMLLVYTDHGEELWDHRSFSHGHSLAEEVTASFALFVQPGNLEPQVVTELSSHSDLLPTLVQLYGLDTSARFTGGVMGESDRELVSQVAARTVNTSFQSLRGPTDKLLYRWDCGGDYRGGPSYYFDLEQDPGEQEDRYDVDSARVQALWELLLPQVQRLDASDEEIEACEPGL